jgi:hypothetical protein
MRHRRGEQAEAYTQVRARLAPGASQRAVAKQLWVARSSLQGWLGQISSSKAPRALAQALQEPGLVAGGVFTLAASDMSQWLAADQEAKSLLQLQAYSVPAVAETLSIRAPLIGAVVLALLGGV